MQITEHFQLYEFAARDVAGGPMTLPEGEILDNVRDLAEQLEVLRIKIGQPITVLSGYRTPAHNARVKGATESQHLLGRAADIRVKGMLPQDVASEIEALIKQKKMKQGGIGVYSTFVHYDTRGHKARW